MSKEFIIINLDSGDMMFLGNQRHSSPVPEAGIMEEHRIFDELPMFHTSDPPEEGKPDFRDFYKKSGHILNFFLAHSRGCRLMVLDIDDYFRILAEIYLPEDPEVAQGVVDYDAASHLVGKIDFFARRLKNIKPRVPVDENEKQENLDRLNHYKDEIKSIIKKNVTIIVNSDGEKEMILETGGLPPNPVFVPWDADSPW